MAGYKQEARIEDWYFYHHVHYGKMIVGRVFRHPRFDDGTEITTTPIVKENLERNVAESRNTIYLLGRKKA